MSKQTSKEKLEKIFEMSSEDQVKYMKTEEFQEARRKWSSFPHGQKVVLYGKELTNRLYEQI